jgi:hypothetical protein
MDLSETIAPTSDQLDAVDLLGGPRTFTIKDVRTGNAEQPVQVDLVEFPRPWRPGKSMRRVLVAAWGKDGATYAGRRVRLYCDPNVTFGKDKVGGTRISHLSHIDKTMSVPLLVTRGRSAMFTVDPLPDDASQGHASPEPTADAVAACDDIEALKDMWRASGPELRVQIEARVAALNAAPGEEA